METGSEFPIVCEESYCNLLENKRTLVEDKFRCFYPVGNEIFVIASKTTGFRLRCRFQVIQDQDQFHYYLWEQGKPTRIESFSVASALIQLAMPILLELLPSNPHIATGLQAVHFLSTLKGDLLVTLIYKDNALGSEWEEACRECVRVLKLRMGAGDEQFVGAIGRSKGVLRCDRNYVEEVLNVGERKLHYRQVEGSFSNPNGEVNELALQWICSICENIVSSDGQGKNLVELYCGNGNHTVALAKYFLHVLAVEIDNNLCEVAKFNFDCNDIQNVILFRDDSKNFCRTWQAKRKLYPHSYETILVDPPRAGLDRCTLDLVTLFDNIIYISCNPLESFYKEMESTLCRTHRIVTIALFDQFPYTKHIECGFYLTKL